MSVFQRRCFVLAIGLGLLYLVLLPFKPYPLGWLLKPLPMLLFALLVWRAFPGAPGRWLAAPTCCPICAAGWVNPARWSI